MHGRLVSRRIDALYECFLVIACDSERVKALIRTSAGGTLLFLFFFSSSFCRRK